MLLIGPRLAEDGPREKLDGEDIGILEHVDALMETEGIDQKTALKRVARQRGITRREAYRQMVEQTSNLRTEDSEGTSPAGDSDQD